MYVLCTFKITKENQNLDQTYLKIYELNSNHDQDAKLQSGTSSILQCLKWGLNGHSYSFYLQNKFREPRFGLHIYQILSNKSKSLLRCQTPNWEHPTSSKVPNRDSKDMDILCTYKVNFKSIKNSSGVDQISWTKSKSWSWSSSKAPNQDLYDMDVF